MSDPSSSTSTSTPKVALFKKPKVRPTTASRPRQRSPSPDRVTTSAFSDPSAASGSAVVKVHHKVGPNPLIQGTKRLRSTKQEREKHGYSGQDASSDAAGNTSSSAALGGWRAGDTMSGTKRGLEDSQNGFATRGAYWDVENGKDENGGGIHDTDAPPTKRPRLDEDGNLLPDDGMYHGKAGYSSFLKEASNPIPTKMRAGPQKASNNIRTITVTDYQPDVCKDYKETGFCGYGDSCKFLHDRGDYLAGWQLDKLAVNASTGLPANDGDDSDDDEEVPFACLICRQPFKEPVVTKCGHYFCMDCAIKRFSKTPKCYACGTPTGGMFNKAEKILAKMNAKKEIKMDKKGRDMFGDVKEKEEGEESDDGGIEFGVDEGEDEGEEGEGQGRREEEGEGEEDKE